MQPAPFMPCWPAPAACACRVRLALVALALLGLAAGARAGEDALPLKTLSDLKAASVFLKVTTGKESGSGSGFVIRVDGADVFVVTNHHVVTGPSPGGTATVTAVFGSGTPAEQMLPAEVLATDSRRDLAVLRVRGVRNLPAPIDLGQEPKLVETMPVFIFGYPLGELLATSGKGHPAITVGRGSVSSIRLNDRGELTTVQIDGDITPGNSGGPVVDAQGHLVGIAAATVRNRRIGFAIPATQLRKLLHGHLVDYRLTARQTGSGTLEARVELGVFDPLGQLRGVTFLYLPQPNVPGKKLAGTAGVQKVTLRREGRQLVGTFPVSRAGRADAPVCFQAVFTNGEGKTFLTNPRVQRLRSAPAATPVVANPVPRPPQPDGPPRPPRPSRPRSQPAEPLDDAGITQAIADLRMPDNFRRKAAAERLTVTPPSAARRPDVLAALLPVATDPDRKVMFARVPAVKAYVAWAGKDGVPTLYKILDIDCVWTRPVAVEALAKLDGANAAAKIAPLLANGFSRGAVGKALREIGPPAEKAVLSQLENKEWVVRMEACRILEAIGSMASVGPLRKASTDSSPAVAFAARKAVQVIEARKAGR